MTDTQEEVKPMDKGPWWRRKGEVYIFSDDFKHDVKMKVDGDWGNAKEPYLDWLVDHLNRTTEEALRAETLKLTANNGQLVEQSLALRARVEELGIENSDLHDSLGMCEEAILEQKARIDELEVGLNTLVDGLEALPKGQSYTADMVQNWVSVHLISGITAARKALNK